MSEKDDIDPKHQIIPNIYSNEVNQVLPSVIASFPQLTQLLSILYGDNESSQESSTLRVHRVGESLIFDTNDQESEEYIFIEKGGNFKNSSQDLEGKELHSLNSNIHVKNTFINNSKTQPPTLNKSISYTPQNKTSIDDNYVPIFDPILDVEEKLSSTSTYILPETSPRSRTMFQKLHLIMNNMYDEKDAHDNYGHIADNGDHTTDCGIPDNYTEIISEGENSSHWSSQESNSPVCRVNEFLQCLTALEDIPVVADHEEDNKSNMPQILSTFFQPSISLSPSRFGKAIQWSLGDLTLLLGSELIVYKNSRSPFFSPTTEGTFLRLINDEIGDSSNISMRDVVINHIAQSLLSLRTSGDHASGIIHKSQITFIPENTTDSLFDLNCAHATSWLIDKVQKFLIFLREKCVSGSSYLIFREGKSDSVILQEDLNNYFPLDGKWISSTDLSLFLLSFGIRIFYLINSRIQNNNNTSNLTLIYEGINLANFIFKLLTDLICKMSEKNDSLNTLNIMNFCLLFARDVLGAHIFHPEIINLLKNDLVITSFIENLSVFVYSLFYKNSSHNTMTTNFISIYLSLVNSIIIYSSVKLDTLLFMTYICIKFTQYKSLIYIEFLKSLQNSWKTDFTFKDIITQNNSIYKSFLTQICLEFDEVKSSSFLHFAKYFINRHVDEENNVEFHDLIAIIRENIDNDLLGALKIRCASMSLNELKIEERIMNMTGIILIALKINENRLPKSLSILVYVYLYTRDFIRQHSSVKNIEFLKSIELLKTTLIQAHLRSVEYFINLLTTEPQVYQTTTSFDNRDFIEHESLGFINEYLRKCQYEQFGTLRQMDIKSFCELHLSVGLKLATDGDSRDEETIGFIHYVYTKLYTIEISMTKMTTTSQKIKLRDSHGKKALDIFCRKCPQKFYPVCEFLSSVTSSMTPEEFEELFWSGWESNVIPNDVFLRMLRDKTKVGSKGYKELYMKALKGGK